MIAAPPALSGFASRSWLASIQADSLKSGRLSRSAMRKVQARPTSRESRLTPLAVPLLLKPRPHVGTTALITWRTAVDADEIAEDELSACD